MLMAIPVAQRRIVGPPMFAYRMRYMDVTKRSLSMPRHTNAFLHYLLAFYPFLSTSLMDSTS